MSLFCLGHEPIQSQIDNFVWTLYGDGVVKTDDGAGNVTWSLPCNLDTGLIGNPRALDEGIACYFLRLMREAVYSFTGPAGPAGADGVNGNTQVSVLALPLVNPAIGGSVSFLANNASTITAGSWVFIEGSGWYFIDSVDSPPAPLVQFTGTFHQAASNTTGTAPAGSLVILVGAEGEGAQGPLGPVGPSGLAGATGPTGATGAGSNPSSINGFFYGDGGTDFSLPNADGQIKLVDFGTGAFSFDLSEQGTYLVLARVGWRFPTGSPTTAPSVSLLDVTPTLLAPPGAAINIPTQHLFLGYFFQTLVYTGFMALVTIADGVTHRFQLWVGSVQSYIPGNNPVFQANSTSMLYFKVA